MNGVFCGSAPRLYNEDLTQLEYLDKESSSAEKICGSIAKINHLIETVYIVLRVDVLYH